jgi:hypothetical protein
MLNYTSYNVPREELQNAFSQYLDQMGSQFIATQVFPVASVSQQAATYPVVTIGNFTATPPDNRRASGSDYLRIDTAMTDFAYNCIDRGLEKLLPDDMVTRVPSYELAAIRSLAHQMLLSQEARVASKLFNTTTFAGASLYLDASSTAPWATVGSDVIGTIGTAATKIALNSGATAGDVSLVISETNYQRLRKNTGIRSAIAGAAIVDDATIRASLAGILGIKEVVVGKKSAGAAGALASVWSDTYASLCLIGGSTLDQPSCGKTFLWTPDSATNGVVEVYREDAKRGDVVRVRHNVDEQVVEKAFGFLIKVA